MSILQIPSQYAQLPLIRFDVKVVSKTLRSQKRKVDETIAQIHQLRDQLNSQLYSSPIERPYIHAPSDAAVLLDCFIGALSHEEMWIVNMDTRNRVMSLVQLYRGSVNSSQVRVCEVFRQAIIENAPAIIVAHNHPSGDVSPSNEDCNVTKAIFQAGKLLDVELLDHVIISQGQFTSLKEKGLGFN